MKKYKIRFNCSGFIDVVVNANNKDDAKDEARKVAPSCHNGEWEFCEFLEVDSDDEVDN